MKKRDRGRAKADHFYEPQVCLRILTGKFKDALGVPVQQAESVGPPPRDLREAKVRGGGKEPRGRAVPCQLAL
jgi:hypothetical protein